MSNQVEQIRAEVERRIKSWAAGVKYEGDAGDCQSRVTELTDLKKIIDSLPAKENPILVPESKETPFVEAEQPQEKDYKKLYEELVNSEWYKKYYQGASAGDSVAVEQPEEEAPARPANPLVPDPGLTIDGKRYVKRYFRIGDACSRCAFKVGEDAKGHARCKDHGKTEKPCTPDREKGVLVYFIAADQLQEEIHSLQEWAKIMAERPDLRAEFDKMCPPQPIQGSIAPEADVNKWVVTNAFLHCEKAGKIVNEMYGDKFNNLRNRDKYLAFLVQVDFDDRFGELAEILQRYGAMPAPKEQPEADFEAEYKRYIESHKDDVSGHAVTINIKDLSRHFAEWGAEHLKR